MVLECQGGSRPKQAKPSQRQQGASEVGDGEMSVESLTRWITKEHTGHDDVPSITSTAI